MVFRLIVEVEGSTEEDFVQQVLQDHLIQAGYHQVSARQFGNQRLRVQRGGVRSWPAVAKEITARLKNDAGCAVTTFVDYYGMPDTGDGAWPGRAESGRLADAAKGAFVEAAMTKSIAASMGHTFDPRRFVPFTMVHEFEALLFSDPGALAHALLRPGLEPLLREIRAAFANPEEIDDSPETAPSKRLEGLIPGYQKRLSGMAACRAIGLARMRVECPHFNDWLTALERLPNQG